MQEKELYVLEYSKDQDCFHVQELHKALQFKMKLAMDKEHDGYMIIAISSDRDTLSLIMKNIEIDQTNAR